MTILLRIILATSVIILYAGNMTLPLLPLIPEIAELLGIDPKPIHRHNGARAAFCTLLAALLLVNNLLPLPNRQRRSDQSSWLLHPLTVYVAGAIGWHWLQEASGPNAVDYLIETATASTLWVVIGAIPFLALSLPTFLQRRE